MTDSTDAGPLDDLKAKFPNGVWTTRANTRLQNALIEGSGLGNLRPAVGWAARMQGTDDPRPFASPRMLLFAGEYPDDWAAGEPVELPEQVLAAQRNEGLLGEQAARAGIPVEVVQTRASLGEDGPLLDGTSLTRTLALGRETADRAIDGGADILLVAGLGAGAASAAVAVCSFIAKEDVTAFMPQLHAPGGLVDDASWMARVAALRDHLAFNRGFKRKGDALVTRLAGGAIGTMSAAIVTAASRSVPVLIDGPAAVAAMMVARDFALAAPKWCYAPNRSSHAVVAKLTKQGGLAEDFGLSLDLGDGPGLLVGWDLLQQSLRISAALPMAERESEESSGSGD
ncbi:nicotinate-nucleotide--dimethylbenzimidazole phosphoribosyltransferase [Glycomyces xiaoerkulensis]|uniref:nicotinate-nucleotide--dimethylbenzimidazole phosphoribosyltransferase n=1 Tax=Glycomyces xiaoerkulensis TaxID=2038139 RepID=UPI000C25748D|nr:nicotinate-nucleotide--dimethylbenzimidazole phosphoribosyltransferase [Glycomyces xiaoerkulensis]